VPYKGADILIRAAAPFLQSGSLILHIIGDGPQREVLHNLVTELGVEEQVLFHGWIAHTEVQRRMAECDFLGLPSIREFGGGVVLEAMALGIAPVVADYGGPAELVDETVGIRVPFTDEASLLEGFRRVIADLIGEPERLNELGHAANERVGQKYTWQAKARQIASVYEAVMRREKDLRYLST
jgi:glycosyltransferase involved in cell wall biosynthesis